MSTAHASVMVEVNGGAEEDRTPDLRIANATLSQLSYRPGNLKLILILSLQSSFIIQGKHYGVISVNGLTVALKILGKA